MTSRVTQILILALFAWLGGWTLLAAQSDLLWGDADRVFFAVTGVALASCALACDGKVHTLDAGIENPCSAAVAQMRNGGVESGPWTVSHVSTPPIFEGLGQCHMCQQGRIA